MDIQSAIKNFDSGVLKSVLLNDIYAENLWQDDNAESTAIPKQVEDVVSSYLKSKLGSADELTLKKLTSLASVIEMKKGKCPKIERPEELACTIDDMVTRMKVYYQQGEGLLDSTEAVEALIDQAEVRVVALADEFIDNNMSNLLRLACAFPPLRSVAPFIPLIEPVVTKVAKKAVRVGVSFMAKTAKGVVKRMFSKTSELLSRSKIFAIS